MFLINEVGGAPDGPPSPLRTHVRLHTGYRNSTRGHRRAWGLGGPLQDACAT
jgi:hypothetical protein